MKILLNRKMTRGSIFSLLQSVASVATYFLTMRLLIAQEGTAAVGLWSLTVGTVAMIRLIDISGGAGLTRLVSRLPDGDEAKLYTIDTITLFVLAFHVAIVAIGFFPLKIAIANMVPANLEDLSQQLVVWASIILIMTVVGGAQSNAIDGLHMVDVRSQVLLISTIIFGVISFFAIPRWGIQGMVAAQFIQNIMILVGTRAVLVLRLRKLHWLPRWVSKSVLKNSLSYGAKVQASSVPILIYEPMARVVINHFAGLHILAIYDLAYKLCIYTRNLIQSAAQPIIPLLSDLVARDVDEADKVFRKSFHIFIIGGIAIFTAVSLASPLVSYILLGTISKNFLIAAIVISLACMVGNAAFIPYVMGIATGDLRWNIIGQWSIAILTMLLIPVAAYSVGTAWVALGTAVAIAFGNAAIIFGNLHDWNFRRSAGANSSRRIMSSEE